MTNHHMKNTNAITATTMMPIATSSTMWARRYLTRERSLVRVQCRPPPFPDQTPISCAGASRTGRSVHRRERRRVTALGVAGRRDAVAAIQRLIPRVRRLEVGGRALGIDACERVVEQHVADAVSRRHGLD